MLSVAQASPVRVNRGMTDAPEIAERKLIGRALAALRERAEMSQPDAADAAGVTLSAWQNYEYGRRIWKPALLRKVTAAIGTTVEALEGERARLDGDPVGVSRSALSGLAESSVRSFELPLHGRAIAGRLGPQIYDRPETVSTLDLGPFFGSGARAIRLAGESMVPYAEPGGFVVFDVDRWPRRGQGCVIETEEGEFYIKRYDKTDGSTLYVTELWPEEKTLTFPMLKIRGVYAVILRGD